MLDSAEARSKQRIRRRRGMLLAMIAASSSNAETSYSLTKPTATWISDAATAQAVFEIIVDDDVVSGDKIWGESSTDNFATVLETVSAAISAGDLVDLQIDDFAFSPFTPDGTYYVRFWVSNSADTQISPKSDVISLAIDTSTYAGTYYYLGF